MTPLGRLQGTLPNLDCDESGEFSPSQNWFYHVGETWFPWGRRWHFKVKGSILTDLDSNVEKWFCLQVFNNWDYDRDKPLILETEETQTEVIEESVELPTIEPCCEEQPIIEPSLREINSSLCPCESGQSVKETEITFLKWYRNNLQSENDSPQIQAFLKNFKESSYYQELLEKNNIVVNVVIDQKARELEVLDRLIETMNSQLVDGLRREEDIDYIMLKQIDAENQILPITAISLIGTFLTLTLV